MTDLEILNTLFRRQGYVVMATPSTYKIGDMVRTDNFQNCPPVVVKGPSTVTEYAAQNRLVSQLNPDKDTAEPPDLNSWASGVNFYRVEAVD